MTFDYGVEYVEASVRMKGFEQRIAQILEPTFIDIHKETEIAVKKVIESYDFQTAIENEIRLILTSKLKETVRNTVNHEFYKNMPYLQRVTKKALTEKLNEDE
jgi:hypothetical protein